MSQFVQSLLPDTPRLFSHYTKPDNIISMLDVGRKCVCFWLKTNSKVKAERLELIKKLLSLTVENKHVN